MGILLICYSSDTYDLEEYETETVGLPRHTLMSAAAGLAGMAAPNAYHAGVIFFQFFKKFSETRKFSVWDDLCQLQRV